MSKRRRHESALLLALRVSENAIASREPAVTRTNMLYLVIGALAVAVVVMSYQLYQDSHQPEGVHIEFGPGGLSIQGTKSK
jgi:RsiW-degrading membrane proteinase PrsW (M82 family)